MEILDLPNELILLVGENLPIRDLSRFLLACRRLSSLFNDRLYSRFLQDEGEFTVLQSAAKHNQTKLAKFAISNGARVSWETEIGRDGLSIPPALHTAARYNSPDVMRVLFEHGAMADWGSEISGRGSSHPPALHTAARYNSTDVIQLLFERGADIDAPYNMETPLYVATFWRNLKAIEVLLKLGAKNPPEPTHPDVSLPTHLAARRGYLECMEAFVATGFDFDVRSPRGETVLHAAAFSGEEMVQYLLQQEGGAQNIMARDSEGKTPLHSALWFQPVEGWRGAGIVRLLLRYGANTELINTQNLRGDTPLHLAVLLDSEAEETVRLLLLNGAKTELKNALGSTPADLARQVQKTGLRKIILEYGANVSDQEC